MRILRTKQSTFIEILEQFFDLPLSDSVGDVRSASKEDLHALRSSILLTDPPFRANLDGQSSIIDGASQVQTVQSTKDLLPPVLEEQKILQVQQEWEEARKRWKAQKAAYAEEIASLQARLARRLELGADGHTGEPEGRAAPMPLTDTVLPSSTPQSLRPVATYRANEKLPSLRKRKGAFDIWRNKKRVTKRLHDDDDVTMIDATNYLPISSTGDATPSPPTPRLGQRLSQAFPARFSIITGKARTHNKVIDFADTLPETLPSNLDSQRPSSWPRAQQWRKSIGVSVKFLRDNFEKLALESKDLSSLRSSTKPHAA